MTQVTTQFPPARSDSTGVGVAFVRYILLGGLGADRPQRGAGARPRVEARSAAGLVLVVAVACAARSARRGERKPMRWAGAPRALSPTRPLAAGVVGGTCPFSARSFCAGVRCAGHFACVPVAVCISSERQHGHGNCRARLSKDAGALLSREDSGEANCAGLALD